MTSSTHHYLLLSNSQNRCIGGHWRFVLESLENGDRMDVRDNEPETSGERLELMAVLRGLEALDQPSRVTLVTPSRYVARGIRFGLEAWRQNGWHWEHHGEMVPIRDHDLWQRVDQAMSIHDVRMRHWTAASVAANRGLRSENAALVAVASGGSQPQSMAAHTASRRFAPQPASYAKAGLRLVAAVKTMLRRLLQAVDLGTDHESRAGRQAQAA